MDNPDGMDILVKFREAPGYKKVGATGVWGGITSTGQLLCHFFIEYEEIPSELKHTIQADGNIVPTVEVVENQPTATLIREFQVGVLLPPHVARSIGEWFISQSDALARLLQTNNPQMG